MKYLKQESLKKHTSIKIGGPADYFCAPKSVGEIKEALFFAREHKLPYIIIGAGTNLLALDKGFRGLVIKLSSGLDSLHFEKNTVTVDAGVRLSRLIRVMAGRGYGNLEFLAGVPGSVGGAIAMNAGAWGEEISKYVKKVRVMDESGNEKVLSKKMMGFGYRKSLAQKKRWVVLGAVLCMRKKKSKEINERIQELHLKRKKAQPLGAPNCGSVFKNPQGHFAGKLIEEAGLKGRRIGDAQISEKHGNFIVNLGDAKASDVIKLMTVAQRKVEDKFKIRLEPEIKIMLESAQ